ncbi:hypothetical protein ACSMXM_01295 [Pacificimonas sp. ICDLI1SI03]
MGGKEQAKSEFPIKIMETTGGYTLTETEAGKFVVTGPSLDEPETFSDREAGRVRTEVLFIQAKPEDAQREAASLRHDLSTMCKERDEYRDDAILAESARKSAEDAQKVAEQERDDALANGDEVLRAQVEELTKQVATLEKAAKKAASVTAAGKAPKAAKAGPMTGKSAPDTAARKALFDSGAAHYLVLSDGATAIGEFERTRISGNDAWRQRGEQFLLAKDKNITVTGHPQRPLVIKGFALFDEKDNQVDYGALPSPITVPAGQQVSLDGQIVL